MHGLIELLLKNHFDLGLYCLLLHFCPNILVTQSLRISSSFYCSEFNDPVKNWQSVIPLNIPYFSDSVKNWQFTIPFTTEFTDPVKNWQSMILSLL